MVRLNDRRTLCLAAAVATLCVVSSASARVTGVPTAVARSVDAGRTIWVSLTDKGPEAYLRTLRVEDYVSTRALERMRRRGGNPDPVQSFPLYAPYLTQLEALGAEIVGESRWTNTVALRIRPDQLPAIAELPFVSGLRPTARLRQVEPVAEPIGVPLAKPAGTQQEGDVYSYGASRNQLALLQIPTVHALGLDGTGVRIGVLDTGFKIDNGVFDSLKLVPGGTWDFLNNDSDVDDGEGGSARHGTNVLSLLAGFVPGELIGAAPGAEYALAKSEDISQEVYEEEVHWVEALHWAVDSLGCDLVSSSLGYSNWYTDPAIFDGDSALSTVAADLAVARGALVINAVGNEGCGPDNNLIAPADGDSVLAVGATRLDGQIASFSSCGPTYDGRVKPDVVAPGNSVYLAYPTGELGRGSGTSFATPLVTGVCALVLQRYPDMTAFELLEHIRSTASRPYKPLRWDGYGMVQAAKAVGLHGPLIATIPPQEVVQGQSFALRITATDKDGDALVLNAIGLPRNFTFVDSTNNAGALLGQPDFVQLGTDEIGIVASDGLFTDTAWVSLTVVRDATVEATAGLFEPWPNPAAQQVSVAIPSADIGKRSLLQVFTVDGRPVYEARITADSIAVWTGQTQAGERVAAGIYLMRITTPSRTRTVKIAWRP